MGCEALVILAAGAGRRFGGPKQLAPVGPGGETLMEYTMFGAREAGFRRLVVVTRPDLAVSIGGRCRSFGAEIVVQPPSPRGTVPAVVAAGRVLEGDQLLAVVNADDLYPAPALHALHGWEGPGHAVAGFRLAATLLAGSGTVNRALCQVGHPPSPGSGVPLQRMVEVAIASRGDDLVATEHGTGRETVVPGDQLVSMNAWTFQRSIWPAFWAAVKSAGSQGEAAGSEGEAAGSEGEVPGSEGEAAGSEGEAPGSEGEVLLPVVVGDLVAQGKASVAVLPVDGRCVGLTWPGELPQLRQLVADMVEAGRLPRPTGSWR